MDFERDASVIRTWIQGGSVNVSALTRQLSAWLDYFVPVEQMLNVREASAAGCPLCGHEVVPGQAHAQTGNEFLVNGRPVCSVCTKYTLATLASIHGDNE